MLVRATRHSIVVLLAAFASIAGAQAPLGTACSHQGQLTAAGAPVSAKFNQAWGGLFLHTDSPPDVATYARVRFYIRAAVANEQLRFVVIDGGNNMSPHDVPLVPPTGDWQLVEATFAQPGVDSVSGLVWQDTTGGPQPAFYVDEIGFVAGPGGLAPASGRIELPPSSLSLLVLRFGAGVGDLDCNGVLDFGDINAFVLALAGPAGYGLEYPDCDVQNADCNGDGLVAFNDGNPFVDLLAR